MGIIKMGGRKLSDPEVHAELRGRLVERMGLNPSDLLDNKEVKEVEEPKDLTDPVTKAENLEAMKKAMAVQFKMGELRAMAKEKKIKGSWKMREDALIEALVSAGFRS